MGPQPSVLLGQLSLNDLLLSASTIVAGSGLATALIVMLLVAEEFLLFWRRTSPRRAPRRRLGRA